MASRRIASLLAVAGSLASAQLSPSPSPTQFNTPTATSSSANITVLSLGSLTTNGLFRQGAVLGGAAGSGLPPTVWSFDVVGNYGFLVSVVGTNGIAVQGGVTYLQPTNVVTMYRGFTIVGLSSTAPISLTDSQWVLNRRWYISLIGGTTTTSFNMTISAVIPPTPQPSPGLITPLALGEVFSFTNEVANSFIFFSITMPLASIPLGFQVRLQPSSTTDSDLYFSTIQPVGNQFTQQLWSEFGVGTLDQVTVTSASQYWLPAGGPYYINVKGYSALSTWTLVVIAVPPSPSPAPYVPTAAPYAFGLGRLSLGTIPGVQLTMAPGAQSCYRAKGEATWGRLSVAAMAIDPATVGTWISGNYGVPTPITSDMNVLLYVYPSWPIASPPIIMANGGDNTAPVSARTVRIMETEPWWVGYSGQYFVCVNTPSTNTAPVVVRLNITAEPVAPSSSPAPPVIRSLAPDTPTQGLIPWAGSWDFYSFSSPATAGNVYLRTNPIGGVNSVVVNAFSYTAAENWVTRYAARIDSGFLIMTAAGQQKGYAWLSNSKLVYPDLQISFDFTVSMGGGNGDGLCFVVQNDNAGMAAEGGTGDSLGLGKDATNAGIGRSLSVCIDTYNNGNGFSFSTYLVLNGNVTCGRVNTDFSGCSYQLPDLTAGALTYTMSIEYDGANNAVWWDITSTYSGVVVGSYMEIMPNLQSVLGSPYGWVGFSAATGGGYDVFTVLNYYWGTRDRVTTAQTGGDTGVYVGMFPPVSRDSFSSYEVHSQLPNTGNYVTITPLTGPLYRQPNGTYYLGVYCAGPAGCAYLVEGHVGSSLTTPTRSPQFVTPSNTQTRSPSPQPARQLQALVYSAALNGAQTTAILRARSSNYYSFQLSIYGPVTFYLTGLPPVTGTNMTPNFNLEVSRAAPRCTGVYVNASDEASSSGGLSCAYSPDLVANNPDPAVLDTITISPGTLDYPDIGGMLYVRVYNTAPNLGNDANTGAFLLRIAVPDGGPGAAPAAAVSQGLIIGIVVGILGLLLVLGVLAFATIVLGKKYGSRAQVITVMTSSTAQEEVVRTPYIPAGTPPPPPSHSSVRSLAGSSRELEKSPKEGTVRTPNPMSARNAYAPQQQASQYY